MKKVMKVVVLAAMVAAAPVMMSCSNSDDIDKVNERVDKLTDRVKTLETQMATANNNIATLQQLVEGLTKADYVTDVTETTNGYTLTLNGGKKLDIKNGEDGYTPVIGVKQDEDGNWYWTLDRGWLLDGNGQKIRVNGTDGKNGSNGTDGVTPQLRINDSTDMWEVSYDKGKTWTSLGVKATGEKGKDGNDGDAFFKGVKVGTDNVTFTLTDGTTFELPLFDSFKKVRDRVQSIVFVPDYFDNQIGVKNDEDMVIRYQVKPAAIATWLAEHQDAMQLVGEEVITTRSASATLAISSVRSDADGMFTLMVKPTGFEAQQGYAFALDVEADGSSYRTAYTPTFLIVEAEKIALGVMGLYPNMGIVTGGKYFQLYAVFFPDYTTSRGITWTTSDATLATVNKTGVVAVSENAPNGTFTITATTTNNKTASLTFNIVDGMIQIDTDQLKLNQELAQ